MKAKKNNTGKTLHGNNARINQVKDVTPLNLTNTIVPKEKQVGNKVPQPTQENVLLAKEYVDENHK